MPLDSSVRYVKGVGPELEKKFSRLGVTSIRDLLFYYPVSYQDRTRAVPIAELEDRKDAFIRGEVISAKVTEARYGLGVFESVVSDGKAMARVTAWRRFNPHWKHDPFSSLKRDFEKGREVLVWGYVRKKDGFAEISLKEYEPAASPTENSSGIVPVYPLTEGITPRRFRGIMKSALDKYAADVPDFATEYPGHPTDIVTLAEALRHIHYPQDFDALERARRTLAYSEYLIFQTALALSRRAISLRRKPAGCEVRRTLLPAFRKNLGFDFTPPQKKAINEIFSDMASRVPMQRILIGDVGCGKTAVAAAAMLLAVENGRQAVMAAPTEVLAAQHFETIKKMTAGLGVRASLLTGALSASKKRRAGIAADIASGETGIIIGTHALIESGVRFSAAGLFVIDEQHKFGVRQRMTLREKSPSADVLMMSATPIPRTLAITVYGDLDVSVIDAPPPGRIPVKTMMMPDSEACEFAKKELAEGNKVFIVYPLVEDSEKLELKSAKSEAERLAEEVFGGYKVGLLHGKMKSAAKRATMEAFRSGDLDVLIATLVVEVGIDVPSATLLIVEHAERYGLASLHQLRGRVGRGDKQSYCVLVAESPTQDAARRLQVLLDTDDGFEVAKADLRLRGSGEIIGTRQHGAGELDLRIIDIWKDKDMLGNARAAAAAVVEKDADLRRAPRVKHEITRRYGDGIIFPQIG